MKIILIYIKDAIAPLIAVMITIYIIYKGNFTQPYCASYFESAGCKIITKNFFADRLAGKGFRIQYKDRIMNFINRRNLRHGLFWPRCPWLLPSIRTQLRNRPRFAYFRKGFPGDKNYLIKGDILERYLQPEEYPDSAEKARALVEDLYNKTYLIDAGNIEI